MKINVIILSAFLIVSTIGCSTQESLTRGVVEIQVPSAPLVHPIWSPSGDNIVASHIAYSEHHSTLYIIDLKTHRNKVLVTLDGEAIAQSWSVDGDNIAVAISESATFLNEGIWVINIANNSNYW